MAAAALLALSACSRGSDESANAGMLKGRAGLEANAMSTALRCLSSSQMRSGDLPPEERRRIISCTLASAAQQLNPQLPRQMDDDLRLDQVSADGPVLTYHFTLLRATAASSSPGFVQQLAASQRRLTCAQPQTRPTLELGGAYAYRWVDNQGVLVHEMRIDAC